MVVQTRDVTPATESVYTYLHNLNPQELYTFMHTGMVATIGVFVGAFLTGIAVILGISSILLLLSRREARSRELYFLCVYTTIILLVLVAFEVQGLIELNVVAIFFFQPYESVEEDTYRLSTGCSITLALLAVLADGLLAWRCFLVQRALGHGSSKWGNLFWIFPACLCGITVVATTVAGFTRSVALYFTFGIVGYSSNVVLNVYATLFITTRLLLHRRMIIACFRDRTLAAQHIYIVGILLESAAVNLPVTIVAAAWIWKSFEDYMLLVAAASQVLAAILIIYQTALGRAFSRRKEIEINARLAEAEMRERNISENVGSSV